MRKSIVISAGIVTCSMAILLGANRTALAQAGSTGGTIGKTDKSTSGGEDESPGRRKSGHRQAASASVSASTPSTISGRWSWRTKCNSDTIWTGEFDFDQSASGAVSGSCRLISGPGENCGALSGHVAGNRMSLTIPWGSHSNHAEFTIAGQSMQGTEQSAANGECRYQVRRLSRR
jgi:hypothetical protein